MKSCFLFGHHQTTDSIIPELRRILQQHITEYDVTEFIVGHYGRFDRLASKELSHMKVQYPHIQLRLLLPYHPATRSIDLPPLFDGSIYPSNMERVPHRAAVIQANRNILKQCNYAIACVQNTSGNAAELACYARSLSHLTLTWIL